MLIPFGDFFGRGTLLRCGSMDFVKDRSSIPVAVFIVDASVASASRANLGHRTTCCICFRNLAAPFVKAGLDDEHP